MDVSGLKAFSNTVMTGFYSGVEQISKNKGTIIKVVSVVAVVAIGIQFWNQGIIGTDQCDFTGTDQCDFTGTDQCDFTGTDQCDFTGTDQCDFTGKDECNLLLTNSNKIKNIFSKVINRPEYVEDSMKHAQLRGDYLTEISEKINRAQALAVNYDCEFEIQGIKEVYNFVANS